MAKLKSTMAVNLAICILQFILSLISNFKGTDYGTGSVKLAFTVFDMEAFKQEVNSKGYKLAYEPKDTGFATMKALTDPDGNYIEFTQLSDRWFKHLGNRRKQGVDVVARWQASKN